MITASFVSCGNTSHKIRKRLASRFTCHEIFGWSRENLSRYSLYIYFTVTWHSHFRLPWFILGINYYYNIRSLLCPSIKTQTKQILLWFYTLLINSRSRNWCYLISMTWDLQHALYLVYLFISFGDISIHVLGCWVANWELFLANNNS